MHWDACEMRNENYYYSIYCQSQGFLGRPTGSFPGTRWPPVTLGIHHLSYKRVLMGLTDRRKTAKNLVDSPKDWKILSVSRK